MRKFLVFSCVLLLAVSLSAQVRTGNLFGRVVDTEGNTLPGVSVTLTGMYVANMTAVTTDEGVFRFLSLPPGRDYAVRLELTGFRAQVEENIVITVGGNTNLTIAMETGAIEEAITVTAVTPVVDTKTTTVGQNVTHDILQSLPSARDPWVVLQMAPGVIADRENVGGTESGMQSTMTGRGSTGYSQNVWTMDGVVITDPAAIGASPSYYDFDAFEEMQVTVGGSDVSVMTGGIALNMVTRRGGNRVTLGGRFYYTDGAKFQADNMTDAFRAEGLARVNAIRIITDYGFNLGAPLVRDKAWFWGSFGVQDIQTDTADGNPFDTMLTNFAAKLNIQIIPENRFEFFIHAGKKEMWGRGSSPTFPPGVYQGGAYHFGSPIMKFQDEHMFGDNLFVSAKYAWSNAGFNLTSEADRERRMLRIWDVAQARYYNLWYNYVVDRPHTSASITANYFNDTLFGVSHEIKVGFEYSFRGEDGGYLYPGNLRQSRNFNTLQIDFTGDGFRQVPPGNWYYMTYHRSYWRERRVEGFSGFLSDTINLGRLNLMLGVRFDQQTPKILPFTIAAVEPDSDVWRQWSSPQVAQLLDGLLPGIDIPSVQAKTEDGNAYHWRVLSPRIGLVWDATGDGKTLAKLSLAQYGDFMGIGEGGYFMPGGTSGSLAFWWQDANNNGQMDVNELYWLYRRSAPAGGWLWQPYRIFDDAGNFTGNVADAAGLYWGGYDFFNPLRLTDPFALMQDDAGSTRTSEAILTLEREVVTDFAISVNATYRRYDHFNWNLKYFPATGEIANPNWYVSAGTLPANLPGVGSTKDAANNPYYYATTAATAYSDWYRRTRQPGRYNDYMSADLVFNKRLSNKWMLNGSFTIQTQAAHYQPEGILNPNNIWALDGRPYAPFVGSAAGKINQYTWSRWLVKAGGLYQLPYGFNVSFQFNAREGWVIREYITFANRTLPNPASQSFELDLTPFGSERLPLFYNLSLRLEKEVRAGDFGRIYLMVDAFNALNTAVENRRYQRDHGTFEWYGPDHPANRYTPFVNYFRLNEILNPRVFRLGVRFQF